MIRVLVAGEGNNELGSWPPNPRGEPTTRGRGVIEALMREVRPDGWEVARTVEWRTIRKYQANRPLAAEERNVLGVVLETRERNCDALAFVRDRDGDEERERDLRAGIGNARAQHPDLPVAAGVVVECLESWLAALAGERGCTNRARAADALRRLAIARKDTDAFVSLIEARGIGGIAPDAPSLSTWLDDVRDVLASRGGG